MGYKDLIITCDENNIASRKIIEKNGGVFLDMVVDPKTSYLKRCYSIYLSTRVNSK